jgi:hypothetical protein
MLGASSVLLLLAASTAPPSSEDTERTAGPTVEQDDGGLLPPGLLPALPFGPASNGGFFGKEVKTAPAAGRKPHIVMVLLE